MPDIFLNDCSLCLEQCKVPISNDDPELVALSCGHLYHLDCIKNLPDYDSFDEINCPMCREISIKPKKLVFDISVENFCRNCDNNSHSFEDFEERQSIGRQSKNVG